MTRVRYLYCPPEAKMISDCEIYTRAEQMLAVVRIEIPDKLKLIPCGGYSYTDEEIPVMNLHPVVMVRINSKLTRDNFLTEKLLENALEDELDKKDVYDRYKEMGYIPYPRFGFITWQQLALVDGNARRLWQLDKLPNSKRFKGFLPISEYKNKYGKFYPEVLEVMHSDKEVTKLVAELKLSDDILFSMYARYCCNWDGGPITYISKHKYFPTEDFLLFVKEECRQIKLCDTKLKNHYDMRDEY